jgi:hypothetical protein
MLKRRHLLGKDEVACVMCTAGPEEDIDHLFFQCSFAYYLPKTPIAWSHQSERERKKRISV